MHGFNICAFGGKTQFENFLRKFSKVFLRKLRKMHYFRRFFTNFKKPCVNFLHVWTKKTNSWKF